jgi:ComF family protein
MAGRRPFDPLRLLYPPKCPFCGKLLTGDEEEICAVCRRQLPFTTGSGGRTRGRFFTLCVSPLLYTGRAREALLRFKFGRRRSYAVCFGRLIAARVRQELADRYDILTWVPVSLGRLYRRGYSQSRLLALEAAEALDCEAAALLRKRRSTPAQSGLRGIAARNANVSGAFAAVHPERFAGRRVLLIDDVVTTGATLAECARVLLTAGAESVVCATLCRRPSHTETETK